MRRKLQVVLPPEDGRPLLLLLNYTGIGDLLLALPLLAALRSRFRALPVVPRLSEDLIQLLHEDGAVEGYAVTSGAFRFDRGPLDPLRALGELSRLGADVAVIYGKPALGHAARLGLLGARRTIFCNPRGRAPSPRRGFEVLAPTGNRTADYFKVAALLGAPVRERTVRLSAGTRGRLAIQARARLPWSSHAVVAPWTSDHRRDAPLRFFRGGAEALIREAGLPVVVIGLERDRVEASTLLSGLPGGMTLDLAGATSLPEVIGLLAGARVLLTNDGGPLHMARLVGTPAVAAFGPTAPEQLFPDLKGLVVLRTDVACSPCDVTTRRYRCPGVRLECLRGHEGSRVGPSLAQAMGTLEEVKA